MEYDIQYETTLGWETAQEADNLDTAQMVLCHFVLSDLKYNIARRWRIKSMGGNIIEEVDPDQHKL